MECQRKKSTYTDAAPFVAKLLVIVFNSETFAPVQAHVHGIRTFASEILVITEFDIADTNLGRNVNGACRQGHESKLTRKTHNGGLSWFWIPG